ncbi:MAG: hypothetical protein ACLT1W_14885 [Alistipes onderdonkii]
MRSKRNSTKAAQDAIANQYESDGVRTTICSTAVADGRGRPRPCCSGVTKYPQNTEVLEGLINLYETGESPRASSLCAEGIEIDESRTVGRAGSRVRQAGDNTKALETFAKAWNSLGRFRRQFQLRADGGPLADDKPPPSTKDVHQPRRTRCCARK